jgi:hypothetical protein
MHTSFAATSVRGTSIHAILVSPSETPHVFPMMECVRACLLSLLLLVPTVKLVWCDFAPTGSTSAGKDDHGPSLAGDFSHYDANGNAEITAHHSTRTAAIASKLTLRAVDHTESVAAERILHECALPHQSHCSSSSWIH